MAKKENPIDQTRLALAALTACIVQALGERDPAFQPKFEENLAKAYSNLQDAAQVHTGAVETLRWVREILKEFP